MSEDNRHAVHVWHDGRLSSSVRITDEEAAMIAEDPEGFKARFAENLLKGMQQARLIPVVDAGLPKQERCSTCGFIGTYEGACVQCGAGTRPAPKRKRKAARRGRG